MDVKHMSHGDDHGGGGGVDPTSIRRGHEEDVSNVSAIWSIPIAVVVFVLLGLAAATGSFIYFTNRSPDPAANPVAVERNRASLNERLGRLGRAGQGSEFPDQPRLEGLPQREGNAMMTSQVPLKDVNPPMFHPEDLRASNFPQLNRAGWVEPGKVARIPITEAMSLSVKDHLFPVRKDPVKLTPAFEGATGANAGRGLPKAPAAPAKHDH